MAVRAVEACAAVIANWAFNGVDARVANVAADAFVEIVAKENIAANANLAAVPFVVVVVVVVVVVAVVVDVVVAVVVVSVGLELASIAIIPICDGCK